MTFVQRHGAAIVYLAIVGILFGLLFFWQQRAHEVVVAGCERGNVIRSQMNTVGSTLSQFLLIAAAGRDASSEAAKEAGDDAKATADANLAEQYRALVPSLSQVPLTDCNNI